MLVAVLAGCSAGETESGATGGQGNGSCDPNCEGTGGAADGSGGQNGGTCEPNCEGSGGNPGSGGGNEPGSGGAGATGTGGDGNEPCTNIQPTDTEWEGATCAEWASETDECNESWMVDNDYCNESCGRCTPSSGTGGSSGGGNISPVGEVEDGTSGCQVGDPPSPNYDSSQLPDPFLKWDGSRVATKEEWRCRRQETRREVERYIFGTKPPKPDTVSGTVSSGEITVNVSHQGNSASFSAGISLPNSGSAPYPVLITYSGFAHSNDVRNEGVAVIDYNPFNVGAEAGTRANKSGAFYNIYGSSSQTGLLAAWAWGVSRILDVIQESGSELLIYNRAAVAGCSRFGKGAFAAGVFDERVALTIPFEGGSGGPAALKSIAQESGAQPPSSAYGETYWLGDVFNPYQNNTNALPVDMHQALAMIAPRGVLILGNPHIEWLSPQSEYLSALAGAEVWKALGAEKNFSYHSAVSSGTHCAARNEYVSAIQQSVRAFLLDNGEGPGVMSNANNVSANLSQWRTWDTPVLQ